MKWLRRRIIASVATQTAETFSVVAVIAFALLYWRTDEGPLTSLFGAIVIAQLVALARVGHAMRNNPLNYVFMRNYVDRPFGYRVSRFQGEDEAHAVARELPGFAPVATIRDPEASPEPIFDIYHDPSLLVAASVSRASGAVSLVSSLADGRVMVTDVRAFAPHERLVMNLAPDGSVASIIGAHRKAVAARGDVVELASSAHQVVLDSLGLEYESYGMLGPAISPFLDLEPGTGSRLRLIARIKPHELTELPVRMGPDLAPVKPRVLDTATVPTAAEPHAPTVAHGELDTVTIAVPEMAVPKVVAPEVATPEVVAPAMVVPEVIAPEPVSTETAVEATTVAAAPAESDGNVVAPRGLGAVQPAVAPATDVLALDIAAALRFEPPTAEPVETVVAEGDLPVEMPVAEPVDSVVAAPVETVAAEPVDSVVAEQADAVELSTAEPVAPEPAPVVEPGRPIVVQLAELPSSETVITAHPAADTTDATEPASGAGESSRDSSRAPITAEVPVVTVAPADPPKSLAEAITPAPDSPAMLDQALPPAPPESPVMQHAIELPAEPQPAPLLPATAVPDYLVSAERVPAGPETLGADLSAALGYGEEATSSRPRLSAVLRSNAQAAPPVARRRGRTGR